MPDETIYKRGEKGKKVSGGMKTRVARIKFKDRNININRLISIGRDEVNDIVIRDDPLVSRRHAFIEKDGSDYYVMDKGSTNGTYVNNNPIGSLDRVRIHSGDIITIGKTKLEIF